MISCSEPSARSPKAPVALTATEIEVVAVAEAFVRASGYTTVPAPLDVVERTPELGDHLLSPAQVSSLRFNSLKPRAFGIFDGTRTERLGWTVIFEYSSAWKERSGQSKLPGTRRVGRAVSVAPTLRQIIMEHRPVYLDAATKRLAPATTD
jgi:hypothetical protein